MNLQGTMFITDPSAQDGWGQSHWWIGGEAVLLVEYDIEASGIETDACALLVEIPVLDHPLRQIPNATGHCASKNSHNPEIDSPAFAKQLSGPKGCFRLRICWSLSASPGTREREEGGTSGLVISMQESVCVRTLASGRQGY